MNFSHLDRPWSRADKIVVTMVLLTVIWGPWLLNAVVRAPLRVEIVDCVSKPPVTRMP